MAKGKRLSAKERVIHLKNSATERAKIFKELCCHIAAGYSLDCFSKLSETTIKEFLKSYPQEFDEDELAQAMRDGKQGWEEIGRRQASGSCIGNSRTWYYNMSHRYGWSDRVEVNAKHEGQMQVQIVSYASNPSTKQS